MKLKSIAVIFAVSAIDLGACGNSETKGRLVKAPA